MATVGEVLNIAYSRNKRAKRGQDTTDNELLVYLWEAMAKYFAMGQRINLEWFTETREVMYSSALGGWRRPRDAESVQDIYLGGTRVVKVAYDNQGAEKYAPALYRTNQVYRIADPNTNMREVENPIGQDSCLTFYYTRHPRPVTSVAAELDDMWPIGHETLLGLDIALILARKDSRHQDTAGIEAMRAESFEWFSHFLRHEDRGTTYPQGRERPLTTPYTLSPGG